MRQRAVVRSRPRCIRRRIGGIVGWSKRRGTCPRRSMYGYSPAPRPSARRCSSPMRRLAVRACSSGRMRHAAMTPLGTPTRPCPVFDPDAAVPHRRGGLRLRGSASFAATPGLASGHRVRHVSRPADRPIPGVSDRPACMTAGACTPCCTAHRAARSSPRRSEHAASLGPSRTGPRPRCTSPRRVRGETQHHATEPRGRTLAAVAPDGAPVVDDRTMSRPPPAGGADRVMSPRFGPDSPSHRVVAGHVVAGSTGRRCPGPAGCRAGTA